MSADDVREGWQPKPPPLNLELVPANALAVAPQPAPALQGRRKPWGEVCREVMPDHVPGEPLRLRAAASQWLKKGSPYSEVRGAQRLLQSAVLPSQDGTTRLVAEETGECGGPRNVKRIKREHAKAFAVNATPEAALLAMRSAGISVEEMPSKDQLKHQSRGEQCVGTLMEFLDNPPKDCDRAQCSKDKILIPFTVAGVGEVVARLKLQLRPLPTPVPAPEFCQRVCHLPILTATHKGQKACQGQGKAV